MSAVAQLRRIDMRFGADGTLVHALSGIDLEVGEGEIVGLVGESGAGKTTLVRCLMRLVRPSAGQVVLEGQDITAWPERRLRKLRGRMTMVFRDPSAVLNPRLTLRELLGEPLLLHTRQSHAERAEAVEELAETVQLAGVDLEQRPTGLPIGMLQRIALGRAIATRPKLVVLDEPTALLDVTGTADLLGMLARLRASTGTAMLLVTDDMATVRLVADRIAVLYSGRIVEQGRASEVLRDPLHPYTQALLSAHLPADPTQRGRRIRLRGEAPDPRDPDQPTGCAFAPRCPLVENRCRSGAPTPNQVGADRLVACVKVLEGASRIPLHR